MLRSFCSAAVMLAVCAMLAVPAAQAQTGVDTIKERGKLIAGVKFDTPPFGFMDNNNEVTGFDVDLVKEVAKALDVDVEFVQVTSPTRIPMLSAGNVDMVAASMTHTRERDKVIDFSITYYTGGQSLLVKKGSDIQSIEDLAGKQVSVQQGTTLEQTIGEVAPDADVVSFKDYNSAWLALRQGRVDALTGSLNILQGFAKDSDEFEIVGERFSTEPFGMGVAEGDSTLRDQINFTLQDLWESGRYQELYTKWFGMEPDVAIEIWP